MESSIGSLGHHVGLHVEVDLQGKTVGGVACEAERWVPGVIVGNGALGNSLTIKLDSPVGAEPGRGKRYRALNGATLDEAQAALRNLEM